MERTIHRLVFVLCFIHSAIAVLATKKNFARRKSFCTVTLFAESDVSETSFLFGTLISQIDKCGCQVNWHRRGDYISKYENTRLLKGPLILVATGGPNKDEQESFLKIPQHQEIYLLHASDESVSQTNTTMYGNVKFVMRNYYHSQMNNSTVDYLLTTETETTKRGNPLWMPLGLSNLKVLPNALRRTFTDRPYLWSWAGSTGLKPERSEMLSALKNHLAASVMSLGVLHMFDTYAGRPFVAQGSMDVWEYSILMQNTQFLPVPAGISAEQFRIWEAFDAGKHLDVWPPLFTYHN